MIKLSLHHSYLSQYTFAESLRDEFVSALRSARSRPVRSIRQFAEEEVYIPKGDHKGAKFRTHRQPVQGAILDSYELAKSLGCNRHIGTCCIQFGKTLVFFVIPAIWYLAEMAETVILSAPTMEMCFDKYRLEIEPVLRQSPNLSWLLPRRGRGSRGGIPESIQLENGAEIKFMSAGGSDVKRSGYTAKVAFVTETDKMEQGRRATSRETNAIGQIEHRSASYGGDSLIVLEGTLTTPEGRTWQEYLAGTQHEFHVECPRCHKWAVPDRSWLLGIEVADNVRAAMRSGYFACPVCLHQITADERVEMVRTAKLVGAGQQVAADGSIVGPIRETDTFSIRANAFHNLFWSTAYISQHAFKTHQARVTESPIADDLEKEENEYYWTTPYSPKDLGDLKLDADKIRTRTSALIRSVVPANTQHTVLAIDVGKFTGWWLALCGLPDGKLYIPAYGAFSAPETEDPNNERGIYAGLATAMDDVYVQGLLGEKGEAIAYDKLWIDGGYMTEIVARIIHKHGPGRGPEGKIRMSAGRGLSTYRKMAYNAPRRKDLVVRLLGDRWHGEWHQKYKVMQVFFDADVYKLRVHRALSTSRERPGSITLYRPTGHDPTKSEHARLSRHFTNEQYKTVEMPSGPTKKWIRNGDNHWLDCCAMALAALAECGWSAIPSEDEIHTGVTPQDRNQDQEDATGLKDLR